ncbi:MAG: hypothetical protein ABJC39_07630 [Chloroflexota bacterium]
MNEIEPLIEPVRVGGRDLARTSPVADIAAAYDLHASSIPLSVDDRFALVIRRPTSVPRSSRRPLDP